MSTPGRTPEELDPALARAWREASGDEPPPQLDDAIRAAARRAVQAGPRPARRSFVQRWRVPLSIAAVVVVSASLTLMLSQRDAHLPTASTATGDKAAPARGDVPEVRVAREAPAPAQASERVSAPPPATITQPPLSTPPESAPSRPPAAGRAAPQAPAPASESAQAEREDAGEGAARHEADSPGAASPSPPPALERAGSSDLEAPSPAAPAVRDEAGPITREEPTPAPAAAARAAEPEPAADLTKKREGAAGFESFLREGRTPDEAGELPGRARLKLQARPAAPVPAPAAESSPEQWIERIRELQRQGRLAEAEISLERFRERYPDFALPADLAPLSREH